MIFDPNQVDHTGLAPTAIGWGRGGCWCGERVGLCQMTDPDHRIARCMDAALAQLADRRQAAPLKDSREVSGTTALRTPISRRQVQPAQATLFA